MSSCLFRLGMKWFNESSIEDIKKAILHWEKTIEETESLISGNRFYADQYGGFRDNLDHAYWFLEGYKKDRE